MISLFFLQLPPGTSAEWLGKPICNAELCCSFLDTGSLVVLGSQMTASSAQVTPGKIIDSEDLELERILEQIFKNQAGRQP